MVLGLWIWVSPFLNCADNCQQAFDHRQELFSMAKRLSVEEMSYHLSTWASSEMHDPLSASNGGLFKGIWADVSRVNALLETMRITAPQSGVVGYRASPPPV